MKHRREFKRITLRVRDDYSASVLQSSTSIVCASASRAALQVKVVEARVDDVVTEATFLRRPRSLIQRREKHDPVFRERMAAARGRAARAMFASRPDSIAAARLQAGFSQAKLAEAIGTSQSHIAKIEAGKVQIQFSTATQLADALHISLDSLRRLIEQPSTQILEVQ